MAYPIHMLWAHPRSVSTAFERVMRERGDLTAMHEPFMYFYYAQKAAREIPEFSPDADHPTDYSGIREKMLRASDAGPVFVKDMAYYAGAEILADAELLGRMTHAFLVRDPDAAAASYARIDPEFDTEELGIAAQATLAFALLARDIPVHIILSETLRADPARVMSDYWAFAGLADRPDALSWDARVPQDWKAVQGWHGAVLSSTGIRPPEPSTGGPLPARLQRIVAAHRPPYDQLRSLA